MSCFLTPSARRLSGPTILAKDADGRPRQLISYHLTASSSATETLYPRRTWRTSWVSRYLCMMYASSRSYTYFTKGLSSELKWCSDIHRAYWCPKVFGPRFSISSRDHVSELTRGLSFKICWPTSDASILRLISLSACYELRSPQLDTRSALVGSLKAPREDFSRRLNLSGADLTER